MVLGTDELLKLIKKGLIERLEKEDLNIEGCGIDLHIGKIYEMGKGKGFIFKEERKTPPYTLLAKYKKKREEIIKILPGKFYIGLTLEKINTPKNLLGVFIPRGTFYACGILVLGIKADPGYKGNFRFHLFNISKKAFELEMGARIATMIFLKVKGKTNPYIGQWQGGRVFIKKKEKQTRQK